MPIRERHKIYFASDFHLGLDVGESSLSREKKIVNWLVSASADAKEIYLLGDIFDFWWEYKKVIPKGFTRLLGTISSITDSGIPVHFFTGNHDLWADNYFSEECGMIMHRSPLTVTFNEKAFHLAHGDGFETRDVWKKFLRSIFRNRILQKMYSALHPSIGMWIGQKWSLNSRLDKGVEEFQGEENEGLIRYAKAALAKEKIDYFIFGHRHLAMNYQINPDSEILFLCDWISKCNYAQWDGETLRLMEYCQD